jgi:hypothetical protein
MESIRTDDGMDDLSRQIGELREEMQAGFKDVRSEIKDVRSEIKDVRLEIGNVRSEIAVQVKDVRSEIAVQVKDVRSEMAVERGELRADLGELRKTVEFRFDAVHRWMLGMMGTMLVVVASILVASMRL